MNFPTFGAGLALRKSRCIVCNKRFEKYNYNYDLDGDLTYNKKSISNYRMPNIHLDLTFSLVNNNIRVKTIPIVKHNEHITIGCRTNQHYYYMSFRFGLNLKTQLTYNIMLIREFISFKINKNQYIINIDYEDLTTKLEYNNKELLKKNVLTFDGKQDMLDKVNRLFLLL